MNMPMLDGAILNDLVPPGSRRKSLIREIATYFGVSAVINLAYARGGAIVCIPRPGAITPTHWMAAAVGYHLARKICRHFWSDQIYIPSVTEIGARINRRQKMTRAT